MEWTRGVTIIFDSNVHSNQSVRIARSSLAKAVRDGGARVRFVDIPVDSGVNGVDDLIGLWGKERVIELIAAGAYDPQHKGAASPRLKCIRNVIPVPSST